MTTVAHYSTEPDKIKPAIVTLMAVVFIVLEVYAISVSSHYVYDIPMCLGLLLVLYHWRGALHLSSINLTLASLFLLSHAFGVFELYETYPLGIEYDYWIHSFFGIVCALIALQFLRVTTVYSRSVISVATILLIMGIASLHELYEYAGAILLGKGEGVLFIGAGDLDEWDTHKDILNNLIGGIVGVWIWLLLNTEENP